MDVAATYLEAIDKASMRMRCGQLLACNGTVLEAHGPDASLGELCEICDTPADEPVRAKIVGFRDGRGIGGGLATIEFPARPGEQCAGGRDIDLVVGDHLLDHAQIAQP